MDIEDLDERDRRLARVIAVAVGNALGKQVGKGSDTKVAKRRKGKTKEDTVDEDSDERSDHLVSFTIVYCFAKTYQNSSATFGTFSKTSSTSSKIMIS
jgi:hypothetical protein